MNQERVKIHAGRAIAGVALGLLIALLTPILLIVEFFSPTAVVLLPSIALVALHRWAGRGPALLCAALTLVTSAYFAGGAIALIVLFMLLLPTALLLRWQDLAFFSQLRRGIVAFGAGMLAAVAVLYFSFGGDMISRVFSQFPEMVRALPAEYITPLLNSMSTALGRTLTLDAFYELYDSMIRELVPMYQLLLPQRLFSGVLISALMCAWLSNRMRARRGEAAPGSYVPLRGWALPMSTTGGLVLMLLVVWLLEKLGMRGAETAYYAVYGIASVSFGVQALGSAARRLHSTSLGLGAQHVILIAIALLGFVWLPDVMMVYGCASAIFGSRGAFQQRAQNRENNGRFGGEK